MIPLGEWAPDAGTINKGRLRDARNTIPGKEGWMPFPSAQVTTEAAGATPLGFWSARDKTLGVHQYAGFAETLRECDGDGAWIDRSRLAGGAYQATEELPWRATFFGDRAIATNGVDAMQFIDMATGTNYADLPGAPRPKYVATVGQQLLTLNDETSAMRVAYCASGDSEEWADADAQAGEELLADGGIGTGLAVSREVAFLYQEKRIRRIVYIGGSIVFAFEPVEEERGCVAPGSLASLGRVSFFKAEDGFYRFDDINGALPIGDERVDRWFNANAPRAYWHRMSSAMDPHRKLYCVLFASTTSGGVPDTLLLYNWSVNRWGYATGLACVLLANAISLGVDLESLDDLYDDLDAIPISLDDPSLSGGALTLAAMNATGAQMRFAGPNMEAYFELDDLAPGPGVWDCQGVLPYIDGEVFCSMGGRLEPNGAITTTEEVANTARGGWAPLRKMGRLLRPKFRVEAGATWSKFQGFDVGDPSGGPGALKRVSGL